MGPLSSRRRWTPVFSDCGRAPFIAQQYQEFKATLENEEVTKIDNQESMFPEPDSDCAVCVHRRPSRCAVAEHGDYDRYSGRSDRRRS